MASTACFIIVSRNDIPIYEAEVGSAAKREDSAQLHQFVLHASLDIVQDLAWTTSAMFLKSVDRFNDLVVSVYVTAAHILHSYQTNSFHSVKNITFISPYLSILTYLFPFIPFWLFCFSLTCLYILDLCYFMTLAMMMESKASSKRFMNFTLRLYLIPSTCLDPASHLHTLTQRSVHLQGSISSVHSL